MKLCDAAAMAQVCATHLLPLAMVAQADEFVESEITVATLLHALDVIGAFRPWRYSSLTP